MKIFVRKEVLSNLLDIGSALTRLDEKSVQESDSILIYLNGTDWQKVSSQIQTDDQTINSARQQANERLSGRTLYFAPDPEWLCRLDTHNRHPRTYKPLSFQYEALGFELFCELDKPTLEALMSEAMCASIEEGFQRCIVYPPSSQHFELPSKAHASHFIRLSEAFDSVDSVQRTAYWIVVSLVAKLNQEESLQDRRFIVDHPSMLLLGTYVNQIYGGANKVLCLSGYPSEAGFHSEASKLLIQDKQNTAIIGVASTGNLAKVLLDLAAESKVSLDVCVAFSATELPDDLMPLARLSIPDYFHSQDISTCVHCENEKLPPIEIHRNSFLISIAKIEEIKLSAKFFKEQRSFLDKYGAIPGALRVHFDDPNEVYPRHHAFGIDVTVLLNSQDFLDEIFIKFNSLRPQPDFVVVPNHKASYLLKTVIQKWRGLPVVFEDQLDELTIFSRNPTVLVFDDKIVTGNRMQNLNVKLRTPRKNLWDSFTHIHFFAPIVTTKSEKQLKELESGLTKHHSWSATLHNLYCVHLPDWHSEAKCPWCIEKKLLESLAEEAVGFDSPLIYRLADLTPEKSIDPMKLLPATPGCDDFSPLGVGSVAGNAGSSQLQVLIATASALQQLRTIEGLKLDPHSVTKPTRLASFVVKNAYTEKLIACAILRSLISNEISLGMREFLVNALQYPLKFEGAEQYQIELATALMAGKLGTVKEIYSCWEKLISYGVSENSLKRFGFNKPQSI